MLRACSHVFGGVSCRCALSLPLRLLRRSSATDCRLRSVGGGFIGGRRSLCVEQRQLVRLLYNRLGMGSSRRRIRGDFLEAYAEKEDEKDDNMRKKFILLTNESVLGPPLLQQNVLSELFAVGSLLKQFFLLPQLLVAWKHSPAHVLHSVEAAELLEKLERWVDLQKLQEQWTLLDVVAPLGVE